MIFYQNPLPGHCPASNDLFLILCGPDKGRLVVEDVDDDHDHNLEVGDDVPCEKLKDQ
jgi:hypothetical protein